MFGRLSALLPPWFGDSNPVLDALLWGIAQALAWCFSLYLYAQLQTRIKTATDGWLDMIAFDYFGTSQVRFSGQSDDRYRDRILSNIFRERATRHGMEQVLTSLTGIAPVIFEPSRPYDSGCLGANTGPASFCGVARMGSLACAYSALITVYRQRITGSLAGAGYADAGIITAMNTLAPNSYTGSLSSTAIIASDSAIYDAINSTRPIGSRIGVSILNYGASTPLLSATFVLDDSYLN